MNDKIVKGALCLAVGSLAFMDTILLQDFIHKIRVNRLDIKIRKELYKVAKDLEKQCPKKKRLFNR